MVPPEKKVPGWQDMIDHLDRTWAAKKGVKHYPWKGKDFGELYGLSSNFGIGGIMALWDVYLEGHTYWGLKTGLMVDGLIRDCGVLLDDPRYKVLAKKYQERIDRGQNLHDAGEVLREIGYKEFKIIGGTERA